MLITAIFTILPTLFFYPVFNKFIKSVYLKLSFSWLLGQYFLAIFIFWLTTILSFTGLNNILQQTTRVFFILLLIFFLFIHKKIFLIIKKIKFDKKYFYKISLLFILFLFSFCFYRPHLVQNNGYIYKSQVYWDFQWHAPLIQNFVYGDNFPSQNESFAGMPSTYHFFWGFLVSIYSSSGLDLVASINYVSILTLFLLFVSIIGFSEEVFKSSKLGILAVSLVVTSSSLRFIDYFRATLGQPFLQVIKNILTNTNHPYFFSFVSGNPYGYNGTMFNMFYFLAERQMVFGIIFLLFFVWAIYRRNIIPNIFLGIIGFMAGFYFLWHIFITIIIFCSVLFLIIFDKYKKKTFIFLIPFGFVFLLHILYFKSITNSIWFYPDIGNYPKINLNFPTMGEEYSFSIAKAIGYYVYAYGFKLVLLIGGLFILKKTNKRLFLIFLSIIFPTFLLINTIQLSPLSIYDNHKWLRPMNIFIDLLVAFAICQTTINRKKALSYIIIIILIFLITTSGFIELIPFFNSKPSNLYANYQSSIILAIRENTKPKSVFIGKKFNKEIQLSGRKLFLGDYSGQDLRLRKDLREKIIAEIYDADNLDTFCLLTGEYKIDYVEVEGTESVANIDQISNLKIYNGNERILFVNADKSCGR